MPLEDEASTDSSTESSDEQVKLKKTCCIQYFMWGNTIFYVGQIYEPRMTIVIEQMATLNAPNLRWLRTWAI